MTDPESLIDELKDFLCIAFDDERTDRALKAALSRGMSVIEDYAGATIDYSQDGAEKQLLFDYCRYVRSQAAEMFETNFRHDLIALRAKYETEAANNADGENES